VGTGTDVYLSVCCTFTGSVRIQKGDVISGCFMSQFYNGVNIAVMVKNMIEVFFRLDPGNKDGTFICQHLHEET
jgi:hypothetical protein